MPDQPAVRAGGARTHPRMIVAAGHIEPVPRRVRATLAGRTVVDTTAAVYVWEWPAYPQFYVPLTNVAAGALVDEGTSDITSLGPAHVHGLRVGDVVRPGAATVYVEGALAGRVRFRWDALDAWFEEDEEVFVHPRSPYVRVDAIRSTRSVRIEKDGVVLAESGSPVMVFETGLPTRYYVNRTEVCFEHLVPSDTTTACPYKGTTTGYWSVRAGDIVHADLAWSYDFPTRALAPIAGLIAFYDEQVDVFLDGVAQARPVTHFFPTATATATTTKTAMPLPAGGGAP
jgi:uncharacterized protein (DUF427 family)